MDSKAPALESAAIVVAPASGSEQITPMLLTYNELPNIGRTLAALHWAKQILVIDSGSSDGTLELLAADPRITVVYRAFDSFAAQCNFGLTQVETEWVLSLDADYVLPPEFALELAKLDLDKGPDGYRAAFRYRIFGRRLRGTLYPPRTVLYRVQRASYAMDGHGHRVRVSGPMGELHAKIDHDDRKSLARWFSSQQKYAAQEAVHLLAQTARQLGLVDRLRRMAWPAPILAFFYTLFARGCILDGWPGWYYVLQRTFAELMLALELLDRRLRAASERDGSDLGGVR